MPVISVLQEAEISLGYIVRACLRVIMVSQCIGRVLWD
jgi:hypothetical protein